MSKLNPKSNINSKSTSPCSKLQTPSFSSKDKNNLKEQNRKLQEKKDIHPSNSSDPALSSLSNITLIHIDFKKFFTQSFSDKKSLILSNNLMNLTEPQTGNTLLHLSIIQDYTTNSSKKLSTNNSKLPNDTSDFIGFLIDNGSNVNSVNSKLQTPLHLAVRLSNYKIIDLLLNKKADSNCQDINGDTPMHYAAFKNDFKVIRLLFFYHGSIYISNKNNLFPIDYAMEAGNKKSLEVIIDYDRKHLNQFTRIFFSNFDGMNLNLNPNSGQYEQRMISSYNSGNVSFTSNNTVNNFWARKNYTISTGISPDCDRSNNISMMNLQSDFGIDSTFLCGNVNNTYIHYPFEEMEYNNENNNSPGSTGSLDSPASDNKRMVYRNKTTLNKINKCNIENYCGNNQIDINDVKQNLFNYDNSQNNTLPTIYKKKITGRNKIVHKNNLVNKTISLADNHKKTKMDNKEDININTKLNKLNINTNFNNQIQAPKNHNSSNALFMNDLNTIESFDINPISSTISVNKINQNNNLVIKGEEITFKKIESPPLIKNNTIIKNNDSYLSENENNSNFDEERKNIDSEKIYEGPFIRVIKSKKNNIASDGKLDLVSSSNSQAKSVSSSIGGNNKIDIKLVPKEQENNEMNASQNIIYTNNSNNVINNIKNINNFIINISNNQWGNKKQNLLENNNSNNYIKVQNNKIIYSKKLNTKINKRDQLRTGQLWKNGINNNKMEFNLNYENENYNKNVAPKNVPSTYESNYNTNNLITSTNANQDIFIATIPKQPLNINIGSNNLNNLNNLTISNSKETEKKNEPVNYEKKNSNLIDIINNNFNSTEKEISSRNVDQNKNNSLNFNNTRNTIVDTDILNATKKSEQIKITSSIINNCDDEDDEIIENEDDDDFQIIAYNTSLNNDLNTNINSNVSTNLTALNQKTNFSSNNNNTMFTTNNNLSNRNNLNSNIDLISFPQIQNTQSQLLSFPQQNRDQLKSNLSSFLSKINMEKYTNSFFDEGFDDIKIIINQMKRGYGINDQNLKELGILIPGHRARILVRLQEVSNKFDFDIPFNDVYHFVDNLNLSNVKGDEYLIRFNEWLKEFNGNLIEKFFNNGYFCLEFLYVQYCSNFPFNVKVLEEYIGIDKELSRRFMNKLKISAEAYIDKLRKNRAHANDKKAMQDINKCIVF